MKMKYSRQRFQWVEGGCVYIKKCILCNVTIEYEMGGLNNMFCKSKKICDSMTWQVFGGWEEWSEKAGLMWWVRWQTFKWVSIYRRDKGKEKARLPVSYFWLSPFPPRLTKFYIQIYSFVLISQIHLHLESFSDHPRPFLSCLNTSRTLFFLEFFYPLVHNDILSALLLLSVI